MDFVSKEVACGLCAKKEIVDGEYDVDYTQCAEGDCCCTCHDDEGPTLAQLEEWEAERAYDGDVEENS